MGGTPVKVPVPHFASLPCRREPPMSHKRFLVELSSEERTHLKQLMASGSPHTLPRRRAQIWLLCDQGPEGPAWTQGVDKVASGRVWPFRKGRLATARTPRHAGISVPD